jgi:hypothetical protein
MFIDFRQQSVKTKCNRTAMNVKDCEGKECEGIVKGNGFHLKTPVS